MHTQGMRGQEGGCGCEEVGVGGVLTHLLDVAVEPHGFAICVAGLCVVFRVVGLRIVFGLVHELSMPVSLIFELK